ncbi:MAG: demethoxyubiquinone hydroxylase family protein [Alphaproteobacteria bacterium]
MTTSSQRESRRPHLTAEDALPGDATREQLLDEIIRVDQAGEYGAVRIYAGQLAVLGRSPAAAQIRAMAAKEEEHLAAFNRMIVERRVRPTALTPLWHLAGFALGAATALLGERAAMACTVAVEEVIDEHYARQAESLGEDEAKLRDTIEEFRRDELDHRDTALANHATEAPAYPLLTAAIKAGSRLAIWLSTRV